MPRRTLGERLERARQRGTRAEQEIARLKEAQRKERTRRLIEIGGLAAKAGIDTLSTAALFDRFLAIKEAASDPARVAAWEAAGARHFEAGEPVHTRVGAIATFKSKISPELAKELRELGFRWNRLRLEWEGYVDAEAARTLISRQGGELRTADNPGDPDGSVPSPAPRRG